MSNHKLYGIIFLSSRNQEENYNPYDQNGHLNINRLINGRTKECNSQVLAPRILFLFTDGYFSDDPAVAAQQLCAHNILLVVISIGNYNLRSIAQLTDMCGIMVRVTLNIGDVMELVRVNGFWAVIVLIILGFAT